MSAIIEKARIEARTISASATVERHGGGTHPEAGRIPTTVTVEIRLERRIDQLKGSNGWRMFMDDIADQAEAMFR